MPAYVHGRMEDAHEFMRCLLDAMQHTSELHRQTHETNAIADIFSGLMLTTSE